MTQEIFSAIENHELEVVDRLLANGADPNQTKSTFVKLRPLHAAVIEMEYGGKLEMISLLVSYGADLNATYPDIGGGTPLLVALFNDLVNVAIFLLNLGADPNVKSGEGDTALCWSVDNDNIDIAKLLLSKNAWKTIDTYTAEEGRTALGMAVRRLNVSMVRLLLSAGANPSVRDFNKDSARDCLPEQDSKTAAEWHDIAKLLDANHIEPLLK